MKSKDYNLSVFINAPFDDEYKDIFNAIIFTVFYYGFIPRCALEVEDAGEVRIDKIQRIIAQSKYGIHDICRTELCEVNALPRFNMPFELGLFLGAKKFGAKEQKHKVCLILDNDKWRYQKYISDIAGQDIRAHGANVKQAITQVAKWLRNLNSDNLLSGGAEAHKRYLEVDEMSFNDYAQFVSAWLSIASQVAA
jgi:hypothetical protein